MTFMVLPLGFGYVHCSYNGHSGKHLSMLPHQTKNTSVQIVAISPTGSSMARPEIDFWAKFASDRRISRKVSHSEPRQPALSRAMRKVGSQPSQKCSALRW